MATREQGWGNIADKNDFTFAQSVSLNFPSSAESFNR
jgi:hypothetical protein